MTTLNQDTAEIKLSSQKSISLRERYSTDTLSFIDKQGNPRWIMTKNRAVCNAIAEKLQRLFPDPSDFNDESGMANYLSLLEELSNGKQVFEYKSKYHLERCIINAEGTIQALTNTFGRYPWYAEEKKAGIQAQIEKFREAHSLLSSVKDLVLCHPVIAE